MTKDTQSKDIEKPKISRHQFYFETPLYEFKRNEDLSHVLHSGEVEAYSVMYKSPTTYTISYSTLSNYSDDEFKGYRKIYLKNKRKSDDVLIFFLIQYEEGYMKVGQQPSLADLQYSEITEKYSKQLNDENLVLFKKAIGLAAHGVGAGSFVYLRRIFESLIKSTYYENSKSLDVKDDDFFKLRMTEKVGVLSTYLPPQLVAMKSIYGILSSGVHELSEDECLTYFPAIKLSIELILDEKIDQDQKKEKDKKVKAELQAIAATIKSKS